jgi:carboxylate-amine ligase
MPASPRREPPPTAAALRATFDAVAPLTVGIEEELLLLDARTLDLAPCAGELLERLGGDPRFKPELPAAQVEIATAPAATAVEALGRLAAARADLLDAAAGLVRPAAAGVHPFAAPTGPLNQGERYATIRAAYGPIARRQLVASLQVHVAVGGADRTLAVYDALRSYLPELAALSANAAFYGGEDTGLASVRPTICGSLPRQGVPPALGSWEQLAAELRWGAAAGMPDPRMWWWELRPHPTFGTLELRVPDAQTTLAEAAGVVVVAQALVAWLAERRDAGELSPAAAAASWRIEENRFSALRHGLDGELADLESGEREPTRTRLRRLLDELAPVAQRLGAGELMPHARALAQRNGAIRQREVAAERGGARGLAAWQAERFGDPLGVAPDANGRSAADPLDAAPHRVPTEP